MDVQLLTSSGIRSMQVALHSWYSDFDDTAVLNAGIGCEHLLKAYLASHHPLLIADERDQALRFYAIGRADAAPVPLSHAKTISAEKAFRHAEALMRDGIRITYKNFESILIARNGVAHAAYCDKGTAAETLTYAVALADAIRVEFDMSEDHFWGSYSNRRDDLEGRRDSARKARKRMEDELARRRESYAKATAKRRVSPAPSMESIHQDPGQGPELVAAVKVAYAKKIYEARWGKRKPASIRAQDITRKGDIWDSEGWGKIAPDLASSGEFVECPACGYPSGEVFGFVRGDACGCETPGKGDCQHEGGIRIWAHAVLFHCEACSLQSHRYEELVALGIDVSEQEIFVTPVPTHFRHLEKLE